MSKSCFVIVASCVRVTSLPVQSMDQLQNCWTKQVRLVCECNVLIASFHKLSSIADSYWWCDTQQQLFCGPYLGLPGWANTGRNIHPLTPIVIIHQPLSAYSIYYDPYHPASKSFLVYLLVWNFPLHTPFISSPTHYLLFATLAYTIHLSHQLLFAV